MRIEYAWNSLLCSTAGDHMYWPAAVLPGHAPSGNNMIPTNGMWYAAPALPMLDHHKGDCANYII